MSIELATTYTVETVAGNPFANGEFEEVKPKLIIGKSKFRVTTPGYYWAKKIGDKETNAVAAYKQIGEDFYPGYEYVLAKQANWERTTPPKPKLSLYRASNGLEFWGVEVKHPYKSVGKVVHLQNGGYYNIDDIELLEDYNNEQLV